MYRLLQKFKPGDRINGKVIRLEDQYRGLYIVEIFGQWMTAKSEKILSIGEEITFEVISGSPLPGLKIVEQVKKQDRNVNILISCGIEPSLKNLNLLKVYIEDGGYVQKDELIRYFKRQNEL
ncbi:MAG: hypothetical protein JXR48_15980 [Candidatus Delongbacteria bacterium]|nr:hypothetical protein [Candidatus Delongbacteria bacterium]MBN2836457.1 hypothetical protein [Candidatus Delongbacteria bacterium]